MWAIGGKIMSDESVTAGTVRDSQNDRPKPPPVCSPLRHTAREEKYDVNMRGSVFLPRVFALAITEQRYRVVG